MGIKDEWRDSCLWCVLRNLNMKWSKYLLAMRLIASFILELQLKDSHHRSMGLTYLFLCNFSKKILGGKVSFYHFLRFFWNLWCIDTTGMIFIFYTIFICRSDTPTLNIICKKEDHRQCTSRQYIRSCHQFLAQRNRLEVFKYHCFQWCNFWFYKNFTFFKLKYYNLAHVIILK